MSMPTLKVEITLSCGTKVIRKMSQAVRLDDLYSHAFVLISQQFPKYTHRDVKAINVCRPLQSLTVPIASVRLFDTIRLPESLDLETLKDDIFFNGQNEPITIYNDYELKEGHGYRRILAMKELGFVFIQAYKVPNDSQQRS